MQKIPLRLLALCLLFQSCIRQVVPLQGKYQETPVRSKFNTSFDVVWSGVIDFIADTGQEVEFIDKSSGILRSDANLSTGTEISHEDKKGVLVNPDAYIAVERYKDEFPRGNLPNHYSTAKWTIRVKEIDRDNTEIGVLMHVRSVRLGWLSTVGLYRGKSTGNYEKTIIDDISTRVRKKK